jgi:multisite-specific tRNA:(cytosine-C5)-methyltransferase
MHPAENEAVVAAILEKLPGVLRLVDCSKQLPELRRSQGLTDWYLQDKTGQTFRSENEVPINHPFKSKWRQSMFAPPPEKAREYNLEHW